MTSNKWPLYKALLQKRAKYLRVNAETFDIYQGNLLPYVESDLEAQLSPQSYAQAKFRIPPINILKRIIDKLSKIYQPGPIRTVKDGTDSDSDLLGWYIDSMRANATLNSANEYFNLFKNTLLEPYVLDGKPRLRTIPSDRFIPYSENAIDDTIPTGYVICKGAHGKNKLYMAIEADSFSYFLDDGTDVTAELAPEDNPSGVNTYGVLPFVYINRSAHEIMPVQDSDTLRMTKLIPTILADTNYAMLFQAYSVFYGINVDDSNMKWGPSTFLGFKTDPGTEVKPEVGVLTPTANVDGALSLVSSQLSFWLNSRGIRPGSIGEITATNFQSGISKLVDEMDTSEDRSVQVDYFEAAESQLWKLIFEHMHPVWASEGAIENRSIWSPGAYVNTVFPEQLPPMRRGEIIAEVVSELSAGLTTKERAIKRLNPEMTESEVEEFISEIGGVNIAK